MTMGRRRFVQSITLAPMVAHLSTRTASAVAAAVPSQRFAAAFREINFWAGVAFPGAVVAIGMHGRLVALRSFGKISSAPDAPSMPRDAIFDLASLTKVIGTTTAAELLYDQGLLELDRPVVTYLPAFAGTPGHARITVRHLLSHSSGLFTADLLWQHSHNRQELLALIDHMPVIWEPGSRYQYRDENMILMGEIIERLSRKPLDRFLHDHAFVPLKMKDTRFNPPLRLLPRIPPTEQDNVFRHRLMRGVVHDENAYVLGGVAGHAGLFSTAQDLSKLAELYLRNGQGLLKPASIAAFTARQSDPPGTSRALGWDMPDAGGSFAGPRASPDALIHTGFTGTSIYIDRQRDAFIILLSNRVNPSRDNMRIADARIAIHTAVLSAIDGAFNGAPTRTGVTSPHRT